MLGAVVDWWMDVVVRIVVRHQAKEALNVGGRYAEEFLASEDRLVVEGHAESVLKLHQTANVGVVDLLVGHDPAVGVVMVSLSINKRNIKKKKKKNCQKRIKQRTMEQN